MIKHDATAVQKLANALYSVADVFTILATLGGTVMVGGAALNIAVARHMDQMSMALTTAAGAGLGFLIWFYGIRLFTLPLKALAQLMLGQVQLEKYARQAAGNPQQSQSQQIVP